MKLWDDDIMPDDTPTVGDRLFEGALHVVAAVCFAVFTVIGMVEAMAHRE